MAQEKKITEAELVVMKILWEHCGSMTGAEIVAQLRQRAEWEDSTIYTLIRRLVKKGTLRQEKKGIFYYTPAISEDSYRMTQASELLERVFDGDARTLVSALVRNHKLKEDDLKALKRFWNGGEGHHE